LSEIRSTYSGLISLAVGLLSILVGTVFTLILTRTLNPLEYGTWGLIAGLSNYAIITHSIISYWAYRESARNIQSGKTAVLSSVILSIIGIFVYVILIYQVGPQSDANFNELFFGILLVPIMIFYYVINFINLAWKPHVASYGLITIGIVQIPTVLVFVYYLDMGVYGIILSVFISYFVSTITQGIFARNKLKDKLNKEFLFKWTKLSWVPMYPTLGMLINKLDILVFTLITGSVIGLAFWIAAITITSPIGNAGLLTRPVYAKLLRGEKSIHLQKNLTYVFYFIFPFTALVITFSKPALFALNPVYQFAFIVVAMLAIRILLNTLNNIFEESLMGVEKVDTNKNSTFKEYVKSKLFLMPTLRIIQSTLFLTILIFGFFYLIDESTIDQLNFWATVSVLIQIPFSVYLYILVKKNLVIVLEKISILKYFIVSIAIFTLMYFLQQEFLIYDSNIYNFLPDLLTFVGLGVGGYLLLTCLVDSKTRELFLAIINEFRKK